MDDELARIRDKRLQELKQQMARPEREKVVVEHVDETHFQEFIKTNKYAVVDFWAEWCGPCRRITPIMEELAQEFAGKVAFGKVNTDDNRNLSSQFNISAIPAIMLFSNGQLVERIIGAYPKDAIKEKMGQKFNLK
jgi:thioredoxin 1